MHIVYLSPGSLSATHYHKKDMNTQSNGQFMRVSQKSGVGWHLN